MERSGTPIDELQAALALSSLPGLPLRKKVEWVVGRGSCRAALARRPRDEAARALAWAENEMALCERRGFELVGLTGEGYPAPLRRIFDPPLALYVWGRLEPGDDLALAVVGSRRASAYGLRICRDLTAELAALGFTIVSGLARGIDGAAHQACLEEGGRTLAVLGSGLDRVYPREHARLAERVAAAGAVLSELPLGSAPLAHHFPMRNRVISGLALGTIVVEGAERSGSLISARHALDQNREVFAVPGTLGSPSSRGAHRLIQAGEAKLITGAGDVIEEFPPEIRDRLGVGRPSRRVESAGELLEGGEGDERKVLASLGEEETLDVEELIRRAGIPAERVMAALVALELEGKVRSFPGGVYTAKLDRKRRESAL